MKAGWKLRIDERRYFEEKLANRHEKLKEFEALKKYWSDEKLRYSNPERGSIYGY